MKHYVLGLLCMVSCGVCAKSKVPIRGLGALLQALNPWAVAPKKHEFGVGIVEIATGIQQHYMSTKQLWQYARDPEIDGIIIMIESPGGSSGPAEDFAQAIEYISMRKPVVVYVRGLCASAAYWIAAAADWIVAQRGSMVGSIGVWRSVSRDTRIQEVVIASGKHKHPMIDPQTGRLPQDEYDRMLASSDRMRYIFCERVAQLRGLSVEDLLAQEADEYLAEDAVRQGLVDEVGGLPEAVAALRRLVVDKKANKSHGEPSPFSGGVRFYDSEQEDSFVVE